MIQDDGLRSGGEENKFAAILLPHRALSRKGFVILMSSVGIVSFVAGAGFVAMGAWPIGGFFGLDVILIYLAFRLNYFSARQFEKVELNARELRITRVSARGRSQCWSFNPYWAKLELEPQETRADILSITSHGRRLVFGSFLSDPEKREFAAALQSALADCRAQ